ncbi:MAG: signal peptide peptidase SppA [Phycisphaerae bacterium]|nr:signal peptide peptidase SppA [Phycisphaerae bacterium]
MNDATPPPIPDAAPTPLPPVYSPPPPPRPPRPPRRSLFARLLSLIGCLVFIGSIVMNISLLAVLAVQGISTIGLHTDVLQKGDEEQTVAVYHVDGVIDSEATDLFCRFYRQIRDDAKIKAVVLQVNSPGGTVSDSERIHRMITDLKARGKTVVVSMGGLAASGGYYISAAANEIFAEPATITGSIGVITGVLNLEGTLDKIGMKMLVLKSSHAEGWKDMLSSFREPQPREKKYVISLLDEMQARFEDVVRQGRGAKLKPREETYQATVGTGPEAREVTKTEQAPFNGKIYLAAAAREYGLIDEIGFPDEAYSRAASLAGLSNPHVVEYRRQPNFLEALSGATAPAIRIDAKSLQNAQTPQFLMLWKPEW